MKTGLDRIQKETSLQKLLRGRIGFLCHSASVDSNLNHGIDILQALVGPRLTALFAPQHGLSTDAQDNMIESPHFTHPYYGLPVYSLYSEIREPSPAMLKQIDTLVIDLQDVGVRVYTYVWTMVLAMKACAAAGKKVIVLDRPNPLNGITVEGPVSKPAYQSFIGLYPLPMRHGLTIGEISRQAVDEWGIKADLEVVPVKGWKRSMYFDETGLPWVMPSPNLPTPESLLVYPGTVLFEGTNLSEGRGTTRPFEIIGHPKIKAQAWQADIYRELQETGCLGCYLRPHTFVPTFEKWAGITCHGYQLHVTDRNVFQPCKTALVIMKVLKKHMGDAFQWRKPPFEYEYKRMPIDILSGSDEVRLGIDSVN